MSNKLDVIIRHYNLPREAKGRSSTKYVLHMLGLYADNDGRCFPSLTTLSKQLDMGKNTVIDKIAELEKLNLISVIRDEKGKGKSKVNRYKVNESLLLSSIISEQGSLPNQVNNVISKYGSSESEPLEGVNSSESEPLIVRRENYVSSMVEPESLINHQLITKEDIGSGSNKNSTINSSSSESLILRDANTEQLNIWFNLRAFTKSEPSQKNVVINSMPRTSDLDLIDWVDEIANECECVLTNREHCFRFCQAALIELNTKNNNQADTVNIFYRLKLIDDATSHEEGNFPSWPERLGQWLL